MQLKTYTDFGLRVLVYVGTRRGRSVPRREIATAYGISQEHLRKVIHRMSTLGYVQTTQGKSGGVMLSRSPELVRLGQFVLEMEENMEIIDCNKQECPLQGGCTIKSAVNAARDAFVATLNEYTLAMMLDDSHMVERLRMVGP
ncbi:Rrf2 family transcriptional regulator [Marinobacter sp. SS13-12]|uniref:RrF2 family transcriptional regulator n=1 Tax=Marinobacter sp. SS13-12 TaxID=3050451 RepID=UPI002556C453|nr:Rrf2 family transcriptional regulator [Marinobacter sp. SS13-12]MDK8463312.1 Rrf2 family transcriptional regulator [Marinobacter sp. SS13-12]